MLIKKDLFWNYVSLFIMAGVGLIINTVIIYFYDSTVLGIYNVTYAWYMILSQVAVWGIHMAVVRFIPETDNNYKKGVILKSALLLTFCVAGVVTGIVEITIHFLFFEWKTSLHIAVMGLLIFSINKVLINYLNAINRMVLYAAVQILRYSLLMVIILLLSMVGVPGNRLSFIFPVTELIVFLTLVSLFMHKIKIGGKIDVKVTKELFFFGTKILPSNMVLELNSKVDLICLGIMLVNASQIGVYSFAVMFTEGLYQVFITMRKIINPHISEKYVKCELKAYIDTLYFKTRKYLYVISGTGYVGTILIYCLLLKWYLDDEYRIGVIFITIIGAAVIITGKQIILGDIMVQTGHPLDESIINMITVMFNFIVNIMLIFLVGIVGAAIATALSYVLFAKILKYTSYKRLGISI